MEERNLRKVLVGTVVSNKMDKTIVVAVETSEKHKKWKRCFHFLIDFLSI